MRSRMNNAEWPPPPAIAPPEPAAPPIRTLLGSEEADRKGGLWSVWIIFVVAPILIEFARRLATHIGFHLTPFLGGQNQSGYLQWSIIPRSLLLAVEVPVYLLLRRQFRYFANGLLRGIVILCFTLVFMWLIHRYGLLAYLH